MRKGKVENKLDVVSQDDLFPRDLSIKEESFSTIEDDANRIKIFGDRLTEGSSSYNQRDLAPLGDYGDIPDPLLEDPWDLAEAFEDSFASLSQPMASTNLPSHFTAMELDMQQRKAGAKKMKKEAGDEQQGGSSGGNVESEGDHDGGCSQKTIVDEAQVRLKLSKQIEQLPEPYKTKMRDLCQKYEKQQSQIKGRIDALIHSVDGVNQEVLPATDQLKWKRQSELVINKTLEKCIELLHQLKKNTNKVVPVKDAEVLRKWLFSHFEKPYPTPAEKANLAKLSGYTKKQVSNWFINARVRLWRPMVFDQSAKEMDRQK